MTTYTVFRHDDSSVAQRGLTRAEAANELLSADGYDWEIRQNKSSGGYDLWTREFSRNSPLGNRPLTRTVFSSPASDRALAEEEIFASVIATPNWHGYEAMTDADFDAMLSEIDAKD